MPSEIYILICTAFIVLGVGVIARPGAVSAALKKFYGGYPVVRRLKDEQHQSRKSFVIALGITFIAVGVIAIIVRP